MKVLDIRSTNKYNPNHPGFSSSELLLDNGKWVKCNAIETDLSSKLSRATISSDEKTLLDLQYILTDIYKNHIKYKLSNTTEPIYKIVVHESIYIISIDSYIFRSNNPKILEIAEYVDDIRIGSLVDSTGTNEGKLLLDELRLPRGITLNIGKSQEFMAIDDSYYNVNAKKISNLEYVYALDGDLGSIRIKSSNGLRDTICNKYEDYNIPLDLQFKQIHELSIQDDELKHLYIHDKSSLNYLELWGCYSLINLRLPKIDKNTNIKLIGLPTDIYIEVPSGCERPYLKCDGHILKVHPEKK